MHQGWAPAIGDYRKWLVAAGRPNSTITLRLYQLRRFAGERRTGPWEQSEQGLVDWLSEQEWAAETRRSYRSALRGFYGWGHAAGRVVHDPARLLPPIRPPQRRARPTPELVLAEALTKADDRTRLIVLLAARQGLRRGEIAKIHSHDVQKDLAGWSLLVHGKGDKERLVPLHVDLAVMLRERGPGWVFPGQVDGHLSPRWVGDLVQRVLPDGWTTHTLRHRFATVAYHGSRDLLAVQELLGHSKPETTRLYVQLPDDALRAAMRWAA